MDLAQYKIENEQIVLNIVQESDAEDIYMGIKESLNDLRKFPASLPWALEEPSLEASQAFCRSRLTALLNQENFVFIVRSKISHVFLGILDIHCIRWDENQASVGFWGNARYQGQGYMLQALSIFIDALLHRWAFSKLHAYVDVENSAARKLCERVNFELKEIEFQSVQNPIDATWRDICHYMIENKDK